MKLKQIHEAGYHRQHSIQLEVPEKFIQHVKAWMKANGHEDVDVYSHLKRFFEMSLHDDYSVGFADDFIDYVRERI